jgi:hypothetical protein
MGTKKDAEDKKTKVVPVVATEDSGVLHEQEAVVTDAVINEIPITITDVEEVRREDNTSAELKESVTPVVTTQDIEVLRQTETVIIFKVTRPLMTHEYDELSARVRAENQASGLKIVLAPAIVDGVEISG